MIRSSKNKQNQTNQSMTTIPFEEFWLFVSCFVCLGMRVAGLPKGAEDVGFYSTGRLAEMRKSR